MNTSDERWHVTRRQMLQATAGTLTTGALAERGTANQASEYTVYIGTGRSDEYAMPFDDGTLYAVDAATGTQQWVFTQPSSGVSSPIVVDGTVYVGSWDATLYAVDAATGEQEWAFTQISDVTSGGPNLAPTVVNGTVYTGHSPDNTLYAVDADSGEQEWKQTFTFEEIYTKPEGISSPIVVDDTIYIMIDRPGAALHAIDADSGDQRWTFTQPSGGISSPTVVDGTVYICSDGLYAVDAATGKQEWVFSTGESALSGSISPTVAGNTVYVGSADEEQDLYAVDAESGEQEWAFTKLAGVGSSPTVANETVYVGSADEDSTLYAVDANSGEQEWAYTQQYANPGWFSSPTVVGDTVYVGSFYSTLHAVDTARGAAKWTLTQLSGRVRSPPTVAADTESSNSVGSRAVLGTFGHHGDWRYAGQNINVITENTGTTGSDDPSGGVALGTIEMVAGGGSLAGLLGVYALMRRSSNKDTQTERSPTDPREPVDPGSDLESSNSSKPSNVGPGDTIDDPLPGDRIKNPDAEVRSKRPLDGSDSVSTNSADSTRERSTPGPPETISSPHSRSLNYAEIKKRERIGTGGNADVYAAQLPDGQQVALKEPRMEGTVDVEAIERFVQEAETWDKLDDHDHIVGVVDYGDEPVPWLALEYMDAGDMSAVLATEPSFEARVWIAVSICRGVRHAHRRGVAHLDIKPANVLFRSADETWPVPKVSDWGLAKMLLDHSKSIEGFSPNYAAPEQFAAEEYGPPDDITDIYQVGAVCYKLFTGEPPFSGSHAGVMRSVLDDQPSPPASIAEVPTKLDDVLLSALAKQKADRYESIIELRDALAGLSDYR